MNTEELIKIAEECGGSYEYTKTADKTEEVVCFEPDTLQQFAERIAQLERDRIADKAKDIIKRAEKRGAKAEREACADICDERARTSGSFDVEDCAILIRARGEK